MGFLFCSQNLEHVKDGRTRIKFFLKVYFRFLFVCFSLNGIIG
jgi:hypothetical protein